MLDPTKIDTVFRECLIGPDELDVRLGVTTVVTIVDWSYGNRKYTFSQERLVSHHDLIKEWLSDLPAAFATKEGIATVDAKQRLDGSTWADALTPVEYLFCLALGLRLIQRIVGKMDSQGHPFYRLRQ